MSSVPQEVSDADLIAILERVAPRSLTIKEIAQRLGLERWDRRALARQLDALAERRQLRPVGKTRYRFAHEVVERKPRPLRPRRSPTEVFGRYTRTRSGYGFVEIHGAEAAAFQGDIFVPAGKEMDALHGDRVRVLVVRRDFRTQRASGRVVAVVERAHREILGRLELVPGPRWKSIPSGWRLLPFSEVLPVIEVVGDAPPSREDNGRTVLVRLTRPPVGGSPWRGEVTRRLGGFDDPEVQFLSVATEHGIPLAFEAGTEAEAARLPPDPRPDEFEGREDLRELAFVTIDGETARDFDDAVHLEATPGGGRRLRVAIADVSHYVLPGSALDAEAASRGTSVYFPDRAIPMLPERLSNQLCSLNPERERLVVVAEMEYDSAGVRRGQRMYRAVLKSRARLTYTEVAALFAGGAVWQDPARSELPEMLASMRELMGILHRRRLGAGALDLDLPEIGVELDEKGHARALAVRERNDAHRLIEEFMLEANRVVAEELSGAGLPLPFRIHEPPDPADIEDLNGFLHAAGVHVSTGAQVRPSDIAEALEALRGHRLEKVLSKQILRALKQARYATDNVGHFGLAFELYCHFTSPIRRYPDLLVHRQVTSLLEGRAEAAREAAEELSAASDESSRREREAMEAERAMVDLKKAEFMQGHLHETCDATVLTVTSFGFFAELDPFPVEGLVRIEDLPGMWRWDARSQALYGSGSGRRIRLGDRVRVEVSEVSLEQRQITLAFVGEATAARPADGVSTAGEATPARSGIVSREHETTVGQTLRPSGMPSGEGEAEVEEMSTDVSDTASGEGEAAVEEMSADASDTASEEGEVAVEEMSADASDTASEEGEAGGEETLADGISSQERSEPDPSIWVEEENAPSVWGGTEIVGSTSAEVGGPNADRPFDGRKPARGSKPRRESDRWREDRPGAGSHRRDRDGHGDRREDRGGYGGRRDDRGGYGGRRDDRGGFGGRRDERGGGREDRGGYGGRRDDRGGYGGRRDDRGGFGGQRDDRDGRREDRGGFGGRRDDRGGPGGRRDDRGGPGGRRDDRGGPGGRRDDRGGSGGRREDRGGFGTTQDDRGGYARRDDRGRPENRGGYRKDRGGPGRGKPGPGGKKPGAGRKKPGGGRGGPGGGKFRRR